MELYKNFMSNNEIYDEAVEYWSNMCRNVFSKCENKNDWKPWFELKTLDGTFIRDGNPISTWVNKNQNKGIRIIQKESSFMPLYAYMSVFDQNINPINEIVIHCFLTEETGKKSVQLIESWVCGDYRVEEMEEEIEIIIPKTEK